MPTDYRDTDHDWIRELLDYPRTLEERLRFFDDTSQIRVPDDPIERVIFQDRAKTAIRKVAQNRGHMLMVGRPGTGKSLLAEMFKDVLDRSIGDYLRPQDAIVVYPGKDKNHVRVAYESPERIERALDEIRRGIEAAQASGEDFSLEDQVRSVRKVRCWLLAAAAATAVAGVVFPAAFVVTGLAGMGAIFLYLQENNHRV